MRLDGCIPLAHVHGAHLSGPYMLPPHLSHHHCPIVTLVCAGLDARAAAIVMRCVRNIVNTGRTIGKPSCQS